ncbi:MAG: response regulator [Candidatus Liptonbacteria bacterium]
MSLDHKPLVLIVDDEEDFPEIISAKLSAAGMTTVHVKDPKKAVEEATKQKPDLMLVDISMPELSGSDLMLDLRQNDATKDIKIAFLTNTKEPWPGFSGTQNDIAKELGASDFLQKTEDLDVLLKKIQALLTQNS